MTDAALGYGSRFEILWDDGGSPSPSYVSLGEVINITPPSSTVDQIDVTHMESPGRRREFIDGLIDPGECSFEMNYVPGSEGDQILLAILDIEPGEPRVQTCRIVYPNGIRHTFQANLQSYVPSIPTDDKMTATVSWRVTGTVSVDQEP